MSAGAHTLSFGVATSARFLGAVLGGIAGGLVFGSTQTTAVAGLTLGVAGLTVAAMPMSGSLETFATLNAVLGFAIYAGCSSCYTRRYGDCINRISGDISMPRLIVRFERRWEVSPAWLGWSCMER